MSRILYGVMQGMGNLSKSGIGAWNLYPGIHTFRTTAEYGG